MIALGKWTPGELEAIMLKASSFASPGKRISYISSFFLGTPYESSTLIGSASQPEEFVLNLQGMDCFTFIEYIEAMRLSSSFDELRENLKQTRYRAGKEAFTSRNHFFSDWPEFNSSRVLDVTHAIGGNKAITVRKLLNSKSDGTAFINGIAPRERKISYIPPGAISGGMVRKLKNGDYAGIYSGSAGLDVTHVGIIIKQKGKAYFRHASSQKGYRKVIDQDLGIYIADKPGIIVLRPI